jgi:hypothetical protein
MYRHLTEAGLVLQVLGVIPPAVNSLLPDRDIHDQEFGLSVAGKHVPGRRDYITILVSFALVAAGAFLQFLAVFLAP